MQNFINIPILLLLSSPSCPFQQAFLRNAGFVVEKVNGYQRYPLANHVAWLVEGKPGGHERPDSLSDEAYEKFLSQSRRIGWSVEGKPGDGERRRWLRDAATNEAYKEFLDEIGATDTVIATAVNP